MGSEDFYPEEGPVHEVSCRWLLDGSAHRHQRTVCALRRSDRLCHGRGTSAESRRLSWRPPGKSGPGSVGLPKITGTRGSDGLHQLVGLDTRNELASSAGTAEFDRLVSCSTRWSTSPTKTPKPTRDGRVETCPPKPSGSEPPVAAWRARNLPGAMNIFLMERPWRIPGRANSPGKTC